MVQAWFMDSSDEDQRLPHQLEPPQPVSLEDLKNCGVLYWKVKFVLKICVKLEDVFKDNFSILCIFKFKLF